MESEENFIEYVKEGSRQKVKFRASWNNSVEYKVNQCYDYDRILINKKWGVSMEKY